MSRPLFKHDTYKSKTTILKDKNKMKSMLSIDIDQQNNNNTEKNNIKDQTKNFNLTNSNSINTFPMKSNTFYNTSSQFNQSVIPNNLDTKVQMKSNEYKTIMRPNSSLNAPTRQNPSQQKGRPLALQDGKNLFEKKNLRAQNLKYNSTFTRNNRFKEFDHLKKTVDHHIGMGFMDNQDFLNRNTRSGMKKM